MKAFEALKASSPKNAVSLIMDDESAKRVIVAWTNAFPAHKEDFDVPEGATIPEILLAAWATPIDYEKIGQIAGLPAKTVEVKIRQLASLRLIYPDGTAANLAMQIIEAETAAQVRKYLGRKPGDAILDKG